MGPEGSPYSSGLFESHPRRATFWLLIPPSGWDLEHLFSAAKHLTYTPDFIVSITMPSPLSNPTVLGV